LGIDGYNGLGVLKMAETTVISALERKVATHHRWILKVGEVKRQEWPPMPSTLSNEILFKKSEKSSR